MGSHQLSSLLLRPAPLSRPSLRCLFAPPPRFSPSTQRALQTSPKTPSAQPQLREEEPIDMSSASRETTSQINDLLNLSSIGQANRPMTSSDELQFARENSPFGARFSDPTSRNGVRPRTTLSIDELNMPDEPEPVQAITIPEEDIKYPRLGPAYGRSVELNVDKGRDIVRGISMLGTLIARNKVRQDVWIQRFHERPGLKRKRLNSVRWRARFKAGFGGICSRVTELTRKGW